MGGPRVGGAGGNAWFWLPGQSPDERLAATPALWTPDMPPVNPDSQNDEFTGAVLDPKWTEWDVGNYQTVSINQNTQSLRIIGIGNGTDRWGGIFQPVPAVAEYALYAKMSQSHAIGNFSECALFVGQDMVANPATADFTTCEFFSALTTVQGWIARAWAAYNSAPGATVGTFSQINGHTSYFRIRVLNGDCSFDVSRDGASWMFLGTTVGLNPVSCGIAMNGVLANTMIMDCAFFRVFEGAGTAAFASSVLGRVV